MFYFKNSFSIVIILSVVCFSFTISADDDGYTDKVIKCKEIMMSTFGQLSNSISAIQTAIMKMKLYGEHKFIYDDDITMYYGQLHTLIKPDNIILPRDYCDTITNNFKLDGFFDSNRLQKVCDKNKQKCIEELSIFEEHGVVEELLLNDNIGKKKRIRTSKKYHTISDAGSSSSGTSSETNMKSIILKNALYYHKEGDPPPGVILTEETKKYFHDVESYGHFYLQHIAEVIDVIFLDERTNGPREFCIKRYSYRNRIKP